MYNHRAPKDRVEVVDLDPYGTAAPFIDAAAQCVQDGGTGIKLLRIKFLLIGFPTKVSFALRAPIFKSSPRRTFLKNGGSLQ